MDIVKTMIVTIWMKRNRQNELFSRKWYDSSLDSTMWWDYHCLKLPFLNMFQNMNSYLFMIKNQIRVSNMNEYVLSAIMSHRF